MRVETERILVNDPAFQGISDSSGLKLWYVAQTRMAEGHLPPRGLKLFFLFTGSVYSNRVKFSRSEALFSQRIFLSVLIFFWVIPG